MDLGNGMGKHDQASAQPTRNCRDSLLNLSGVMNWKRLRFGGEPLRRCFSLAPKRKMSGGLRVHNDTDMINIGGNLFQYLNPLATHGWLEVGEASDIPARMSQASDERASNRIGDHDKNDWRVSR